MLDSWIMIKERYMLLFILIIIILASLFLLYATWKSRSDIPKSLTVTITVLCALIIATDLVALVFMLFFGYNS